MADEEAVEEEGGGGGKLFLMIAVVLVLLLGGGGAYYFMFMGEEEKVEESTEPQEKYDTFVLSPFVVNLSRSTSYLKVQMVVEYDVVVRDRIMGIEPNPEVEPAPLADGSLPPLFDERAPMIKDSVIRVLSAKTSDELFTEEGKELLKEELIEAVNEATGVDDEVIVNIYFEDFIVQ